VEPGKVCVAQSISPLACVNTQWMSAGTWAFIETGNLQSQTALEKVEIFRNEMYCWKLERRGVIDRRSSSRRVRNALSIRW
jgi:hypothetical protein